MTLSAMIPTLLLVAEPGFRPPAVPLVCHDPYFSIWSFTDRLTDDWPRHWTGAINAICGLVRIDGAPYRFCGPGPDEARPLEQVALEVHPTRTVYRFAGGGIGLELTFTTPALPHDLDLLARPVSYLTSAVESTDGAAHRVELYLDVTGELAVNTVDQPVAWSRAEVAGLTALRIGTVEQPVLAKRGDNLRIDWGHAYLAAPREQATGALHDAHVTRTEFSQSGGLPAADDAGPPRPANQSWPAMALCYDLGAVTTRVERWAMLAYDDEYSIEYHGERLLPWWRRNGDEATDLLQSAAAEYPALRERCAAFDAELTADLTAAGGSAYADIATLAFRQCLAAHKLAAGPDGTPLYFSKENFSNGCIATVDVTYPSAPFMLLFSPELLRGMLIPILDYAASDAWPFAFAPHDLGTYPLANGQVYGGGAATEENQMPVEECGNMLLLVAALCAAEESVEFAERYEPVLRGWAEYLLDKGLDPENQLCTDDFAGHLAHNANLSLKATLALGAWGELCRRAGRDDEAGRYQTAAEDFAARWMELADDGDHYRLAFDRPGTWSMKYNLVWDRLLGLNLFPAEVARREVAWYLAHQNDYGLPLDSREAYTKSDWLVWCAVLADERADFDALIAPLHRFLHETPDRLPFTDWYRTTDATCVGFRARSVVGGVFLPMLADAEVWRKWVGRAER